MATPRTTPPPAARATGVTLTLIGIALVYVAPIFDGLAKGFFQGGGIACILLGVATLSGRMRKREDSSRGNGMWLPSRDGERRP